MRQYGILLFLITCTAMLFAQDHTDLLTTDSSWKKEVFHFPLSFAPGIPLKGVEEARFPRHWADTNSIECWSYVFVWNIRSDTALAAQTLEAHLQTYFNGLMDWQQTNALLLKTEEKDGVVHYQGKIRTFDAFFTKRPMTLHVSATSHYCRQQKRVVVLFRFSPQELGHEIWQKLNTATLRLPECER